MTALQQLAQDSDTRTPLENMEAARSSLNGFVAGEHSKDQCGVCAKVEFTQHTIASLFGPKNRLCTSRSIYIKRLDEGVWTVPFIISLLCNTSSHSHNNI